METKKPEMVVCPKAKECGDECFYPIHKTPHEFMLGSCATITIGHACPACIPVPSTPAKPHRNGDGFDLIENCLEEIDPEPIKPKIVCLCGSTRFSDAFIKAFLDETLDGKIVLTVGNDWRDKRQWQDIDPQKKIMLDQLHKRKIDLADEVLILNVGDYIGESTKGELEYAKQHGKTIRFLEPHSCQCSPPS